MHHSLLSKLDRIEVHPPVFDFSRFKLEERDDGDFKGVPARRDVEVVTDVLPEPHVLDADYVALRVRVIDPILDGKCLRDEA